MIEVEIAETETDIFIPNVIIPNENGTNNRFQIFTSDSNLNLVSCDIFDRWGNKVYTSDSNLIGDINWDGYISGELLEIGVYVYKIILVDDQGVQTVLQGDITLLR